MQAAAHQLVRQKGQARVRLYKVKGHSGDPWNDLADTLAALGREHGHNQGKPEVEAQIEGMLAETIERTRATPGGQDASQTQPRQGDGVT